MAEASLAYLLNKIDFFVTKELGLRGSIEERINELKSEHEMITEVLKGADALREQGNLIPVWIQQLRDIDYEIESVLDRYAYKNANGNANPWYDRWPRMTTHSIAKKIHEIETKLIKIKEKKEKYPSHSASTSAEHQAGIAPLYTPETEIVGVEGPREELASWVLDVEQAYRMMFVVGMGGSGKTALVKMVYEQLKTDFDCHVWLTASMFEQMDELLIVLDNWNREDWESVKYAFPKDNISRVIFTTRRGDIASSCRDSSVDTDIYKIPPLPFEKAQELFCRRAFPESGMFPSVPGLREVSERLLKNCEGLPLGIIEMGKHLSHKEKSVSIFKKMESSLLDELKLVAQVLLLGYSDLPNHLKCCFLYMSMFPKDHPVNRRMLIRLEELMERNLVQASELEFDGRPRTCRLHNLMHKIVLSKSKDENFCTVTGDISEKMQRLSIQDREFKFPDKDMHHVRTFFSSSSDMRVTWHHSQHEASKNTAFGSCNLGGTS